MPDYEFTDPESGLSLTVTGPTPPSEAILRQMFADASKNGARKPQETPGGETSTTESGEPTATMKAVEGSDTAPVTLGDLIDNPGLAIRRMVSIVGKDMKDPKLMVPLVAGLGAKAIGMAADQAPSMPKLPSVSGMVTRAAQKVTGGMNPEVAADVVGVLSPRAGNAIRTAGRMAEAVKVLGKEKPPPPAEAAPMPAPTPDVPVTPTRPVRMKTEPAGRRMKATPKAEPENAPAAEMPSFDDLHLTPAEITQGVKWHEQGVSPEAIVHRIIQARQLTARIGATQPDVAAEAVRHRNATGRWANE